MTALGAGCGDDEPASMTTASSGGGDTSSSSSSFGGSQGGSGGAAPTTGSGGDGGVGGGELVWPSPEGPENGSPWLREHHAELVRIEPRVLVLDVVHKPAQESSTLDALVDDLVSAFADGSRYHGYSDPNAQPFLSYTIDKVVDLKDPGGAEYPELWPPQTPNGWDVGQLFTEEFAPRLGYEDPDAPGQYLTMCELFERGIINELWISAESGSRNIYENQSRLQGYDEDLQPIAGDFNACTNGCFYDPGNRVSCTVSTRMLEINKQRGPGCGTHAAGHAQESLRATIPYLDVNAARFFRFDLDARYGFSQPSLYACAYDPGMCVDFPEADRIVSAELWPGSPFDTTGWGAGCGNVHFAANSRSQYDYYSATPASSSCENYGLGDGPGGADSVSVYTDAKSNAYEAEHPDCGGGWIVYMGQSMPGYGNQAQAVDGSPMRNWWPFLFY
ncbi:MAG: hypothetical protein WKG00_05125 [Polyangiaceae bacterium]